MKTYQCESCDQQSPAKDWGPGWIICPICGFEVRTVYEKLHGLRIPRRMVTSEVLVPEIRSFDSEKEEMADIWLRYDKMKCTSLNLALRDAEFRCCSMKWKLIRMQGA